MENTFWNNRYSQSPELYGEEPNQYFQEKINQLQPGKLLLPGEGEGRQAMYAAWSGWQVTAFDMSEVARRHALKKAERIGLQLSYQLSRAEDFNFEKEAYDCVGLIFFHLPPAVRPEVHQRIAASVKPGGYLILEAFHPEQLAYMSGGPKSEDMLYTGEMLQLDFAGWEILEQLEGQVALNEGSGHVGRGYVTRLFARKSL